LGIKDEINFKPIKDFYLGMHISKEFTKKFKLNEHRIGYTKITKLLNIKKVFTKSKR
jgi:hypothetical protein